MLEIKFIRENQDKVKKAIIDRGMNFDLDVLIDLDNVRRKLIIDSEAIRSRRNELNEKLKKGPDQTLVEESKKLKEELDDIETELIETEKEWNQVMMQLPNIPLPDVPVGDAMANKVVTTWGDPPKIADPKDHTVLGETLDIIDIPRAAKVSGARFGYWKGAAAIIEFALIQFALKLLTSEERLRPIADKVENGYSAKPFIPIIPPVMIKPDMYRRAGRLSDEDKDERYYLQQDDLYLVGSSEHTLVTMHADENLEEDRLPLRYAGFSTCFRREAGSYGKDTKGMLRVHQFDKLEMESFTTAAEGLEEHKFFVEIIRYILQQLEIPHQEVLISTGDMGKPDARQVDFESWIPSQNKYRETHTADYMSDFQARRLAIKLKRKDGATELVHTNDATAIAFSRLPIAIYENYQQADGSIKVPKVLQEFTGFSEIRKT